MSNAAQPPQSPPPNHHAIHPTPIAPPATPLHPRHPANVLVIATLIFLAALGWRASGIGDYPPPHATNDEFHFLWGGLNLLDSGEIMTWSGLAGSNRIGMAVMDETAYFMVSPAFDHPPLFTLLAGTAAKLTNPQRIVQRAPDGKFMVIWDVNLAHARLMMLPIFAATFWLLFAISRIAFGPSTALLTILIYGFMSHSAIHGRLILSDSLSAVWLLASVWSVQAWLHQKITRRAMTTTVILTTAAALLTKVPAISQVPVLIALLIHARKPREIIHVIAGFFLGVILYFVWAAWFGLENFIAVISSQAARFRGFDAIQIITGTQRLLDQNHYNALVMDGGFFTIAQLLRPRPHPLMLVLPVYLLAFTFFAGDVIFGWYYLPLYPWLALALAVTTVQVYRRPQIAPAVAWFILLLPFCFHALYQLQPDVKDVLRSTYLAAVAIILIVHACSRQTATQTIRISMILTLTLILMTEILTLP